VREFDASPGAVGGRYVVAPGTGADGPRGGAPAYNADLAAVLNRLDYPETEIARLLEG
jgi:hypothetical protein